ncbi:hypothetical protein [Streptomyces fuscichromogenes]|uniref:hypothetical protein n=1 Tax=Streptomyces fuscichromogenes TaxID=1324013 RepID=UPI00166FAC23|nr:hypothetical protein [Streptomyces fuscichromogenes]
MAEGEQLLPRRGDRPVRSLRVGPGLAVARERVAETPQWRAQAHADDVPRCTAQP